VRGHGSWEPWIDYRQTLETCDRAEFLIGAHEVINLTGVVKVEGNR
jgi:hypothetical protein